jgi:hypothetical protein
VYKISLPKIRGKLDSEADKGEIGHVGGEVVEKYISGRKGINMGKPF